MTDSRESASERRALNDAVRELTRADYHLAAAATQLDKTTTGWRDEADRLMRACIALREAIAAEVGR